MSPDVVASLVIPTYNEAENIVPLLEAIHAALDGFGHEIIVVDDDSPDQTWAVADSFAQAHPWVRVHRRVGDRGLSSAVLAGFALAQGDVLGVMDGDCSHDPAILPPLIKAVREGAQLAVGSRRIPGGGATDWPWVRRRMSDLATAVAKALLNLPLSDPMSGYFFVSRSFYEACLRRIQPLGYKILLSFYCRRASREDPRNPLHFPHPASGAQQGELQSSHGFRPHALARTTDEQGRRDNAAGRPAPLSSSSLALLMALCWMIICRRRATWTEPVHSDLSLYAPDWAGNVHGRPLYADLWDNKLPRFTPHYALAQQLFGNGEPGVGVSGVIAALLTLVGLFAAGWALAGRAAGIWMAVYWALLNSDLSLGGNQPFIEVCMNVAAVWALALLALALRRRRSLLPPAAAGMLCAAGVLYKQSFIAIAILLTAGYALAAQQRGDAFRAILRGVLTVLLPGVLIGGALVGYLQASGGWDAFWGAVFVFNRFYSHLGGSLWAHLAASIRPGRSRLWCGKHRFTCCRCSDSESWDFFTDSRQRAAYRLVRELRTGCASRGCAAGIFLRTLFSAVAARVRDGRRTRIERALYHDSRGRRWVIRMGIGAALAALLIAHEAPFYRLTPDQWSEKNTGNEFVATKHVALDLGGCCVQTKRCTTGACNTAFYYWTLRRPSDGRLRLLSAHHRASYPRVDAACFA